MNNLVSNFIILVFVALLLLGTIMVIGELYIAGSIYTCSGIIVLILFEIHNDLKSMIEKEIKKEK